MMEAKFLDKGLEEEFANYGVKSNEEAETIVYNGVTSNWHEMFDSVCYMSYGDQDCLMVDALRLKPEQIVEILNNRCDDAQPECA